MTATNVILGNGSVGNALGILYLSAKVRFVWKDLTDGWPSGEVDVLNVCIPYRNQRQFIEAVKEAADESSPTQIILHSTVAPGTTAIVQKETGIPTVHSPVRGRHNNLLLSLRTMQKYIGADDPIDGESAKLHLELLGLRTRLVMPSVTTEVGKLLSTTYYGVCIAWHEAARNFCQKMGADFTVAVQDFGITYNEGYLLLGNGKFCRPILRPPRGRIGGTCVRQNAEILQDFWQHEFLDLVLECGK